MMSPDTKKIGTGGEERAAKFLSRQGYRILERNYRTPFGEIDLIALDRDELVFVEVKTRTNDVFGSPELAVNPRKQGRMIRAALGYIKSKKLHQVPCRFDVIAISQTTEKEMEHIKDAFSIDRRIL